jgi:hypothetical protein
VVGQLVALHSIQSILRMTFAVAKQDIAALAGWRGTHAVWSLSLPPREVLLACWAFVWPLTCVLNRQNCEKEGELQHAYVIARVF